MRGEMEQFLSIFFLPLFKTRLMSATLRKMDLFAIRAYFTNTCVVFRYGAWFCP